MSAQHLALTILASPRILFLSLTTLLLLPYTVLYLYFYSFRPPAVQ